MKIRTGQAWTNRWNTVRAPFVLLGVAALLGGCATAGGGAGAGGEAESRTRSTAEAPAAGLVERDFYADWYDSTAVVLPPPADAAARR